MAVKQPFRAAMTVCVGLIDTGEAGLTIGAGLRAAALPTVQGYDSRIDDSSLADRVRIAGITRVASLNELADVLICLTRASAALDVVTGVGPRLSRRHLYCDWNTTSPSLQRQLAAAVAESRARFVDRAMLAAVPPHRHAVPVLLSGDGAVDIAAAMDGLGVGLEVLGPEPARASAVKMFRSLLVKGLETLVIECLFGAERFDVADRVLDFMTGSLPMHDWRELACYLTARSIGDGERRADELRQVATTLSTAGAEPLISAASAERLQWFADLRPPASLTPRLPRMVS